MADHESPHFDDEAPIAGSWHYYTTSSNGGRISGMLFICPCGCGELNAVAFSGCFQAGPVWDFNWSKDEPTLSPSVNILQLDDNGKRVGEHWHGWLKGGFWQL